MDKWTTVKTAQNLLRRLQDSWDRMMDGGEPDEGVVKVGGRRTEGLEANEDGVTVTFLKVEWRHECRIALPDGRKVDVGFAAREWDVEEALWALVEELQKEDADEQG
jgi:hypothetical protein